MPQPRHPAPAKPAPPEKDPLFARFGWIAAFAGVGTLATGLGVALGSGDTPGDLAREGPIRVALAMFVILVGVCVSAFTRHIKKRHRTRAAIGANLLVLLGIGLYIQTYVDVSGTNSSPQIDFAQTDDGNTTITVELDRLTAGERLLVTAGWEDGPRGESPPTEIADSISGTRNGVAKRTFVVPPQSKQHKIRVVARVIKRKGSTERAFCDNPVVDRACSEDTAPIAAAPTANR